MTREEFLGAVKAEVEAGRFETEERIESTVDRLLAVLEPVLERHPDEDPRA